MLIDRNNDGKGDKKQRIPSFALFFFVMFSFSYAYSAHPPPVSTPLSALSCLNPHHLSYCSSQTFSQLTTHKYDRNVRVISVRTRITAVRGVEERKRRGRSPGGKKK